MKRSNKKSTKSSKKSKNLSLYTNLTGRRKTDKSKKKTYKTQLKRHRTEFKNKMPKKPLDKFLYVINPKNFSKCINTRLLIKIAKFIGICLLIGFILIGSLFIYYRKDLSAIETGSLSDMVTTTANTYLDRNGNVLWVDTGTDDYKLVVEADELSPYLKQATVAIEDEDFYKHHGVSLIGILRAAINNFFGGSTQGGSTLTQQVIKQLFFADQAWDRSITGIPRKIKEVILSIEIERMYTKDQILALYLNESPYGGRRNGAESAAQTYFDKPAKDLNIAESALLAAIPQSPTYFNPYNEDGNEDLINRQHTIINKMVERGMISQEEADEAKAYPVLESIQPEIGLYENIQAAHFVQYVRSQLIDELGSSVVGEGGLIVTTTLDIRIQDKLEEAMDDMFNSSTPTWAGFDNGAATVEDVSTGQVIAMLGSRDFTYPDFGQNNAAVAYLQPGSSIKPLVYTELFEQKASGELNYGSGSILNDTKIDDIYGGPLYNADRQFNGPMTIRTALATSRNIPAVEAMYISGVQDTLETIRDLGAESYCTIGADTQVGLSSAIGGCGVEQVDLVNAYSTLARGGIYKPQSTVLNVADSDGETLMEWTDTTGERVVSEQSVYIVTDILHDDIARSPLSGRYATGMVIPNVDTSTKTGTSDKGGNAKDIWMMSYSPVLAMGVWLGNHDASILLNGTSSIPGSIVAKVMSYAHLEVYASEGKWSIGDWFSAPGGIQYVGGEIYPSWWSASQDETKKNITFSILSKKKATEYTPDGDKIEIECTKVIDPITRKEIYIASDEDYDATADDDIHLSTDIKPTIKVQVEDTGNNTYKAIVTVTPGQVSASLAYSITSIELTIDGDSVQLVRKGENTYEYIGTVESGRDEQTVTARVIDSYYYQDTHTAEDTTPTYTP